MSSAPMPIGESLQRLKAVRASLLKVHKALLNLEKERYEQVNGRIASTGQFFRLVVEDEWFDWLHPISQFIVRVDEVVLAKEPVAEGVAEGLLDEAQRLMQPNEEGTELERRYYGAIQQDPDIAVMHGEWLRLFRG